MFVLFAQRLLATAVTWLTEARHRPRQVSSCIRHVNTWCVVMPTSIIHHPIIHLLDAYRVQFFLHTWSGLEFHGRKTICNLILFLFSFKVTTLSSMSESGSTSDCPWLSSEYLYPLFVWLECVDAFLSSDRSLMSSVLLLCRLPNCRPVPACPFLS